MLISKQISEKILTISPSIKGTKGGVAMVVKTLSQYYETFNYIPSTKSKNPFVMLWYFGICIPKLLYYIIFKGIKILHIHGASYGSFLRKMILINIVKLFNCKIIYHIHGAEYHLFYERYNKFNIIKKTINKVDVLIVLSSKWKTFFSTITNENKIEILNNMVNKPFIRQNERDYTICKFLFLGQIGERKGVFDLIDVIGQNKKMLEGRAVFHIGGNGESDRLEKLIEEHQLQNIVKFEGWVSGDKKQELLSSCNIYVLPSYNEGLPISILEAMSYEMPIISTNVGGIPEIVTSNENGFIIEPGNKEGLLECINYFVQQPQEIEQMGKNSATKVQNFYPESVIPQLKALYKNLL